MTQEDVQALGNAVLAQVIKQSIPSIRRIAGAAGMDASKIPSRSEEQGGQGRRAEVVPALQKLFAELPPERQERALAIMAGQLVQANDRSAEELRALLRQHGYQFHGGALLKIGVLDPREAEHLPESAEAELAKAIARLADNDESGAITAACGAVDATTTALYQKHNLGDPSASFQAKVNTAINKLGIISKLKKELTEIGIKAHDAEEIARNIHEATKHAAEALQAIRRTNGDVHGTKPTYTRIVYDSIKWSSAICGLLKGE